MGPGELPKTARSAGASVLESASPEPFHVRSYGLSPADLEVEFSSPPPFLVTQLLVNGLVRGDGTTFEAAEVWGWTLGRRLQALLAIAVATAGRRLALQAHCDRQDCRALIELDVDLAEFVDAEGEAEFTFRPVPDAELRARLPTGEDQRYWLETLPADTVSDVLATRLVTCVNDEPSMEGWLLPEPWLDAMGTELERRDPLMDLMLNTRCPACGADLALEFELEAELLGLLANEQRRLFDHIHRLASAYHWTETDILGLSPRRRRYYLTRLNEGTG